MAIQIQTSFIPKKAGGALSVSHAIGGRSVNLFFILALLVFGAVLGLSAAVFFYKSRLIQTIARVDASLVQAKKRSDPVFSDFTLDAGGNVIFNFKTAIDPKLLLYRETLLSKSPGQDADNEALEANSQISN